jgi:hypothetical protein
MDLRALAAACAAGVLLLSGCGAAGGSGTGSSVRVPTGLEAGCPDPAAEVPFPEGDLLEGATRVRLCPGLPLTELGVGEIQAPADLLTSGVAELVSLVNTRDDLGDDVPCDHDAGPELVYWFGYPDGDWRAVELGSYGCHLLSVGEHRRREGGAELAIAFTDALMAQRDDRPTPADAPPPRCPSWPYEAPSSALALEDVDLASATWCVSPRPRGVREAVIPSDFVQRLNTGLWPGLPTRTLRLCGEAITSWIEGLTPWGDAVGYGIDSCGEIHPLHGAWVPHDQERHYVTPELYLALRALPLGPLVEPVASAHP